MFEIILGVIVCVTMAKIADADDQSAVLWFGVTFGLCAASLFLPLPYVRFVIAFVVSFAAMFVYKVISQK